MELLVAVVAVIAALFYGAYNKSQVDSLLNLLKLKKNTESIDKEIASNKASSEAEEKLRENLKSDPSDVEKQNAKEIADYFNNIK